MTLEVNFVKKISRIFLILFILLTVISVHPTKAISFTEAEKYVEIAEKHAGVLKWEISLEYRKNAYADPITYPNMEIFNNVKDSMNKAYEVIEKTDPATKARLKKRLDNHVYLHYKRAQAYIDAITSGRKIIVKRDLYEKEHKYYPISDNAETAYHTLSSEIRKQAILLYRVYGQSTRYAILDKYKTPGEEIIRKTKNIITVKMEADRLPSLMDSGDDTAIKKKFSELQVLMNDFNNVDAYTIMQKQLNSLFLPYMNEKISKDFEIAGGHVNPLYYFHNELESNDTITDVIDEIPLFPFEKEQKLSVITGSFSSEDDQDVYKLNIPSNGRVQVIYYTGIFPTSFHTISDEEGTLSHEYYNSSDETTIYLKVSPSHKRDVAKYRIGILFEEKVDEEQWGKQQPFLMNVSPAKKPKVNPNPNFRTLPSYDYQWETEVDNNSPETAQHGNLYNMTSKEGYNRTLFIGEIGSAEDVDIYQVDIPVRGKVYLLSMYNQEHVSVVMFAKSFTGTVSEVNGNEYFNIFLNNKLYIKVTPKNNVYKKEYRINLAYEPEVETFDYNEPSDICDFKVNYCEDKKIVLDKRYTMNWNGPTDTADIFSFKAGTNGLIQPEIIFSENDIANLDFYNSFVVSLLAESIDGTYCGVMSDNTLSPKRIYTKNFTVPKSCYPDKRLFTGNYILIFTRDEYQRLQYPYQLRIRYTPKNNTSGY